MLLLAGLAACGHAPTPSTAPEPVGTPAALEREAREQAIVERVRAAIGRPYRLGGRDSSGFDCSGLIQAAYAAEGIALPRVSREQALAGRPVPLELLQLRPGDILAFARDGRNVSHVGLYAGEGRFIHSARTGVRESLLSEEDPDGRWYVRRWVGARRILPDSAASSVMAAPP